MCVIKAPSGRQRLHRMADANPRSDRGRLRRSLAAALQGQITRHARRQMAKSGGTCSNYTAGARVDLWGNYAQKKEGGDEGVLGPGLMKRVQRQGAGAGCALQWKMSEM